MYIVYRILIGLKYKLKNLNEWIKFERNSRVVFFLGEIILCIVLLLYDVVM